MIILVLKRVFGELEIKISFSFSLPSFSNLPFVVIYNSCFFLKKKKKNLIYPYFRMGAYYKNMSRTVGSEQDFDVVKVIYHRDYNAKAMFNNDVALLRLDRPVKRAPGVDYVCFPNSGNQFPAGTLCTITGWGTLASGGDSPEKLMQVQVPIVSNADCTAPNSYYSFQITPEMLCAGYVIGGKDTCQGDSGGPLVCSYGGRWYLAGVTSWGYGCAIPDYYGVYANVGNLRDWIASTMKLHSV